jgi:nucleoside-diphosphate-sugar epimerase
MKVLILGGTGAMGIYLSKLLSQQGFKVSVTSRRKLNSASGINYITGDAKDNVFLKSLLNSHWDCVVDFMAYSTTAFQDRLPLLLGNTNQYIYLSSARVYANSDKPLTENSPRLLDSCKDVEYLQTDEYALAKARQENLLIESGYKNWTIIRPYITYADERLQLGVLEKEAWLFRALQERTIVFPSEFFDKVTTMTHGIDVARAILALIGNEKSFGESYHITSDHTRSWENIIKIYEKIIFKLNRLNLNLRYVDIDTFIHVNGGNYQVKNDRLYDRVFDNSKIASFFPIESCISPEDGLEGCMSRFLKEPNFLELNGRNEGRKDKLVGEFTNLKYFNSYREKVLYLLNRTINF